MSQERIKILMLVLEGKLPASAVTSNEIDHITKVLDQLIKDKSTINE
jgi:hypothetical protein